MKLPAIFKKDNGKLKADTKNRLLKNKETILDIMGEKLQGNKCCPLLLAQPCLGQMCMFFMKFLNKTDTGETKEFWNCAHVQQVLLTIELNRNINNLRTVLDKEGDT